MEGNRARKRILALLDTGSFVEVNALVTARTTNFSVKPKMESPDGVIAGYGQIEGNPVFVYSQDKDSLGGTMGEMHAKKICRLYDLAAKTGAPVIGFLDSAGFRLDESVDALDAFGSVLEKQMHTKGNCLQICGVFGQCAGGLTFIPALADFTYMSSGAALFVNPPHTIADDGTLARNFDTAEYPNTVSGQAQVLPSEENVINAIRELVLFLEDRSYGVCEEEELNRMISPAVVQRADIRALLAECADSRFLEIRPDFCPEMVTGFLKLNGILVGAIGNASALYDAKGEKRADLPKGLTPGGCRKAAQFVHFCNAFGLNLLTVGAADGFEKSARSQARLSGALAQLVQELYLAKGSTRVSLLIGDTYGTAYTVMNAKAFGGADLTFAWSGIKTGMLPADQAAAILYADQDIAETAAQAAAFDQFQNAVESAAARGSVDAVIDPAETRKHLIMAFSML